MNDELRVKNNELGGKMNYRYRTAEEMKDSGVECIGKIPKEWSVNRLKNITNIFGRIGFRGYTVEDLVNEGEGAITLSPSNIENQSLVLDKKTYISWSKYEESPEIKIYNGDIVFVKTASVGKAALIEGLNEKATINPQFVVFKNIGCNKKYLYYNTISNVIQQQVNRAVNGGVVGTLTQQDINNYSLPYPTIVEQEKIAKFLDKKTAQFDSIISKKEALIEKLEEAKKSLISEVVTGKVRIVKSSDGYEVVERKKEEMKDSGVEWLGDIPKEWEVKPIKYLFSLRNERNYKEMGEVQLLSLYTNLGVLKQGDVEARGNKVRTVEDYKEVYPNDIIVNIILAWMGAIGMSEYRGVISPAYDIYEPINKNTISKYYHYVFRTGRFAGECYKKGRGIMDMRWRTYSDEFKSILVPDLSVEEKNIIVECIDKKINEVEALIKNIEEQIEKLKEAKQSLISEAVTGKIEILD